MVSKELRNAVKVSNLRSYQIAHEADLNPSTLSRIINNIESVKPGDPRVLRIARVVGLPPEKCFVSQKSNGGGSEI